MDPFPHHYTVSGSAASDGDVELVSAGLETLQSAPPAEFGGPGDRWSPETLLIAAVADCFILSFRAVAAASKFDWVRIACDVTGTLDRVERVTRFTAFTVRANLEIERAENRDKAQRLLEKAEQVCLISNSLNAERHLESEIRIA